MNESWTKFGISLFMLLASLQVQAEIYLVYGPSSPDIPAVVLDNQADAVVLEEGYLSPMPRAWVGMNAGVAVSGAVAGWSGSATTGGNTLIPSVVLIGPTATSSPELSHLMQRGHAWSGYQRDNNATGLGLVYMPTYGAHLSRSQKSARGNKARAQAFRLDYYK